MHAAKFVLIAALAVLASAAEAACFKSKRQPFGLVGGHQDRAANLFLLISEKDEDFDQLRLRGATTDVADTVQCTAGYPATCNFQGDGRGFRVERTATGVNLIVENGFLRLRADEAGNLHIRSARSGTRMTQVHEFDQLPDAECGAHFTPVGLEFPEPPSADSER